jgi:hypothetical protein
MGRIAVVLYSYAGNTTRQRLLSSLCYKAVSQLPDVAVYVTVGPSNLPPPASCYEPLRIDVPTGYEYLPDKTLEVLRWFSTHTTYDYLLKCDDDVILDPSAVAYLTRESALAPYQGVDVKTFPADAKTMNWHRGTCQSPVLNSNDTTTDWVPPGFAFALGTCYMISRAAAQEALAECDSSGLDLHYARSRLDCRAVGCEDMLVASLLAKRAIFPTHSLRIMYANHPGQLLNHYRYELFRRATSRGSRQLCVGVCIPNRAPSAIERPLLRMWPMLSRMVPFPAGRGTSSGSPPDSMPSL